jgi:hypothetical protein
MPASRAMVCVVIVACVLLDRLPDACAQAPGWAGTAPNRGAAPAPEFIMIGTVDRQRTADGSQFVFALRDETGTLEGYLAANPSFDMNSYVGQFVAATVRATGGSPGRAPTLRVSQVTPLESAPRSAYRSGARQQDTGVALASFDEPVMVGGPECASCVEEPVYCVPYCGVAQPVECSVCGRPCRLWGDAQYLLWWTEGMHIPPLETTSPVGTPREQAGVLGEPDTQILLGDEKILEGAQDGLRVRIGGWFDDENRLGLQGEFFGLEGEAETFVFQPDAEGDRILARPFFNINPRDPFTLALDPPPREDAELENYPDVVSGTTVVDATTRLYGAAADLRGNLACESWEVPGAPYSRVDLLAGYRYLRLRDRLGISEDLTSLDPLNPATFAIVDRFDTSNEFHGGDIGFEWEGGWKRWSVDLLLRTAFGNVHQVVNIQGATTITEPDVAPQPYVGGLLAQQSNIGLYSRNRFAVVPEIGVTLGYEVLPHWRLTAGYTLLYWSAVVRSGDQIDRDVNPDQLPPPIEPIEGPLRPAFAFRDVGFWAQGLNLGVQGRW